MGTWGLTYVVRRRFWSRLLTTPFFRDHSPLVAQKPAFLGDSPRVNFSLQVALDSLKVHKTSTPDPLALETKK